MLLVWARGYLCFHTNQALTKILWGKKQMLCRNSLSPKVIAAIQILTSFLTKKHTMPLILMYVNMGLFYHCYATVWYSLPSSTSILTYRRYIPDYQDQVSTYLTKNTWPLKIMTQVLESDLQSEGELNLSYFTKHSFILLGILFIFLLITMVFWTTNKSYQVVGGALVGSQLHSPQIITQKLY